MRISDWSSDVCSSDLFPALAAPVELVVAKALALAAGNAQIELLDVFVEPQVGRRAVHHDAAVFQDVAVVGIAQRNVGVLLGQQETDPLALVQVTHDLADLLDRKRTRLNSSQ